ncbi:hypothetical protein CYY_000535 [Polysphondylium violaceum]|uniref:Multi antimicrobial extrusion family protein n=1 Tax=Polysphondylium violaceum TaxID=133409 RepID=A0A8J4UX31_9MYCE|nr:hypothetical protein CYY_000535 [Polysphondylium violaceum]
MYSFNHKIKQFAKFFIKIKEFAKLQWELSEKEFKILMRWSWPLIISNLLNNVAPLFVNLIFVGRLSAKELAGAALANTWTYCTMALGTGLANAMDTLVSQAYGANNVKMVGLTVQRASIVSTISCVIVAGLFGVTKQFLIGVNTEEVTAQLAFEYALLLLPGLWFAFEMVVLQKYLQGQGIMWPSIVVGVVLNILNVLFNYVLVVGVNDSYSTLGIKGSALATSISRIIVFFLMIGIIICFKLYKETWSGWSWECTTLQGFKEYLKLGVPASIQHASEGWGFEILTILAGLIDPENHIPLDAHSICYNFTMLTYQFPSGIAIAVSVRVGQLLGQGEEARAKRVSWIAFAISLFFMVIIAVLQYTLRHQIGYIYISNIDDAQDVVDMTATILPIAALFQIFDGGQTIFQGIVRGMGRVITGAIANFIAFYVIAIPVGVLLTFVGDRGVTGLWWGLCCGLVLICIGLAIVIFKVNWVGEVSKAQKRTKSTVFSKSDIENVVNNETEMETKTTSSAVTITAGTDDLNDNDEDEDEDDSEIEDISTPNTPDHSKKKKRSLKNEFRQSLPQVNRCHPQ